MDVALRAHAQLGAPRFGQVRSFLARSGTIENCAGGYGGRKNRSWLSCEESAEGLAEGSTKKHGYVFEVPADTDGLVTPVPLKAMGRFLHEAAEQDPKTGIVYLTEDEGPDGFYRFLPNDRNNLSKGGSLWMLAVDGEPGCDTLCRGLCLGRAQRRAGGPLAR